MRVKGETYDLDGSLEGMRTALENALIALDVPPSEAATVARNIERTYHEDFTATSDDTIPTDVDAIHNDLPVYLWQRWHEVTVAEPLRRADERFDEMKAEHERLSLAIKERGIRNREPSEAVGVDTVRSARIVRDTLETAVRDLGVRSMAQMPLMLSNWLGRSILAKEMAWSNSEEGQELDRFLRASPVYRLATLAQEVSDGIAQGNPVIEPVGERPPLYKVDLAPKEDDLIQWDKPLSENPQVVKDFARRMLARRSLMMLGFTEERAPTPDIFPINGLDFVPLGNDTAVIFTHEKAGDNFRHQLIDTRGNRSDYHAWAREGTRGTLEDVRKAIEDAVVDIVERDPAYTGRVLVEAAKVMYGTPQDASSMMLRFGVRGIQYLDGSSRREGEGNFNFVIFDASDVVIDEVLAQRKSADDEEAFDKTATEETMRDMTGAARAVKSDRSKLQDLARQVREEIKGRDADVPRNVEIKDVIDQKDMIPSFINVWVPPQVISKPFRRSTS